MSLLSQAAQPASPAATAAAALNGLVLLTGGLALTPLAVVVARTLLPSRQVFFARWRFLHLLAILLLAFAVINLSGSLMLKAAVPLHDLLLGQVATALGLAAAGAGIVVLARRLDPAGVRCLGLWRDGHARALAAGLSAYGLCVPALVGSMLLWPWLWELLGGEWEPQVFAARLHELSGPSLVALVLLAVLVQPLLEELFFRAFVQPLLVQNLGDRGGIALTSVFFAALHGGSAFLPIFGLSLLLGAVMLRSQRLSAVVVLHALHNGAMVALLFLSPEARGILAPGEPAQGLLAIAGGPR